jgi:hypothetical protein
MKAKLVRHSEIALLAFVLATGLALLAMFVIGGYHGPILLVSLVAGVVAFFVAIEEAERGVRNER